MMIVMMLIIATQMLMMKMMMTFALVAPADGVRQRLLEHVRTPAAK